MDRARGPLSEQRQTVQEGKQALRSEELPRDTLHHRGALETLPPTTIPFFVPNDLGAGLPFPFIDFLCHSDSGTGMHYPFAFVSQDARGPGDEVTTITLLLNGTYEYWMELAGASPAEIYGDAAQRERPCPALLDQPGASTADQRGWHVFNIQGSTGSIISFDDLINDDLPTGAHDPNTDVCL